MAEQGLRIRIEGRDAVRAAAELERFLRDQWATEPRRERPRTEGDLSGSVLRGDAVALTTLVLTIPPAIVATMDLAERLKLRQKTERLLAWARTRGADEDARFYVEVLGGVDLALDGADAGEMIAALTGTDPDA